MKTLFTICLIVIGTQLMYAQQDTLNLNFRDKEVQVLSDEKGNGNKVLTFDDGLKKTRVAVDFNIEKTDVVSPPTSENYFVRKRPGFETKKNRKIYHTLNMRFGLIKLAYLRPESNQNISILDSIEVYQSSLVKNKILESKYHAINWGLDIPTNYKWLNIKTGVGLSSQKIFFDNGRFTLRPYSAGYSYAGEFLDSQQATWYDAGNVHILTSSINIPIELKFNLRKKARNFTIGVNNRFQFRAIQDLNSEIEYSYMGIVYKNHPYFSSNPSFRDGINRNFKKYSLDGTITYGRSLFSVYITSNITPMFVPEFHKREYQNNEPYTRSFYPLSIRFGIQINIW